MKFLTCICMIMLVSCQKVANNAGENTKAADQAPIGAATSGADTSVVSGTVEPGTPLQEGWQLRKSGGKVTATNTGTGQERVLGEDKSGKEGSQHYTILAQAGPLISMLSESVTEGASITITQEIFTVNAATDERISLTELFGEQAVLQALKADSFIKKYMSNTGAADLKTLLASLDGDCAASFGDYLLKSFAFYDYVDDQAYIRVGVMPGCLESRGKITQLGLQLTPPDHLKPFLAAASERLALMNTLHPYLNSDGYTDKQVAVFVDRMRERIDWIERSLSTTTPETKKIVALAFEDDPESVVGETKLSAYTLNEQLVKVVDDYAGEHGTVVINLYLSNGEVFCMEKTDRYIMGYDPVTIEATASTTYIADGSVIRYLIGKRSYQGTQQDANISDPEQQDRTAYMGRAEEEEIWSRINSTLSQLGD